MFDDGAAGDNVYGASIPVNDVAIQYYIYAENTNVGAFSPARAEHEFYAINATYPTLNVGDLVVNEIMASNSVTAADDDGEFEDWFELYNNSANTICLDNLYATDNATNLLKWAFPSGITMAPNSYLIVWADEDVDQTGLHADFKFSSGGERCILSYADGTILEDITFGAQTTDMGYARVPNGTGNFVIQSPTFGFNNESLSVSEANFGDNLKYFPNPTSAIITLENSNFNIESVEVYNVQGQLLFKNKYSNENEVKVDFSNFAKGLYMVTVNKNTVLKIVRN